VELFFEWALIILLVSGLLYFVLDTKDIFWKLLSIIVSVVVLIGAGAILAIGIHYANKLFGW